MTHKKAFFTRYTGEALSAAIGKTGLAPTERPYTMAMETVFYPWYNLFVNLKLAKGRSYMKKLLTLLLSLCCVLVLASCFKTDDRQEQVDATEFTEASAETEPTAPVLDCKSLEAACADSFIDPTKVTVLGGEWAYTTDPNKFVALATVQYTDKDDQYEIAEFVMVGTFGGKTELFHNLNEHSPYTRENALQEFGAVDSQRFPLE